MESWILKDLTDVASDENGEKEFLSKQNNQKAK